MKRHLGQRIAFGSALLCYAAALACAIGAYIYDGSQAGDPVRASLLASVVFFVGCGIVLQVIGRARLRGVLSGGGDPRPTERQ